MTKDDLAAHARIHTHVGALADCPISYAEYAKAVSAYVLGPKEAVILKPQAQYEQEHAELHGILPPARERKAISLG